MEYDKILKELEEMRDEKFRLFNERIVNVPSGTSLGVRIPLLRAYARALVRRSDFSWEELDLFPDTYLEIRMLKCLCTGYAKLSYPELKERIRKCVPVIDGWAVCDVFCSTLKEIKKHREEYRSELEGFVAEGSEFSQRFAYVLMLGCYMEREYLPFMFGLLDRAQTQYYYTKMGAAWLLAEVLVHFYEEGVAYLRGGRAEYGGEKQGDCQSVRKFSLKHHSKKFFKIFEKVMKK